MGIEKIKEKILADTKSEADKITSEAESQATEIKNKNKAEVDTIKSNRQSEINAAVKLYKDKTLAQARLEAKRQFLAKREEIISSFISEAMKDIQKSKGYASYIKTAIKDSEKLLSNDVVAHCNKEDEKIVKDAFKGNVEVGDIRSGVVLVDDKGKKIDLTIETKLENVRQQLTQEVVKIIGA